MRGDKERGRREKEKSFEWSRGVLPQSTVEMGPNANGVVAVVISADPFIHGQISRGQERIFQWKWAIFVMSLPACSNLAQYSED